MRFIDDYIKFGIRDPLSVLARNLHRCGNQVKREREFHRHSKM